MYFKKLLLNGAVLVVAVAICTGALFLANRYAQSVYAGEGQKGCVVGEIEGLTTCSGENIYTGSLTTGDQAGRDYIRRNLPPDLADPLVDYAKHGLQIRWRIHPRILYSKYVEPNDVYITSKYGFRGNGESRECADRRFENAMRNGNAIFVFGGSTVEGSGVPDAMSYPGMLQKYVSEMGYEAFNFGIGSYDWVRQSDLLSYLLRKGYRPALVIYLDGLNDINRQARSRFGAFDKMHFNGVRSISETAGLEVLRLIGYNLQPETIMQKISAWPLLRLARDLIFHGAPRRYETGLSNTEAAPAYGLDPMYDEIDLRKEMIANDHFGILGDNHIETLTSSLIESFKSENLFVDRLTAAYGARFLHIVQPLVVLRDDNFFAPPDVAEKPGYAYYSAAKEALSKATRDGVVKAIDGTGWLPKSSDQALFVSPNHYSPVAADILAKKTADEIRRGGYLAEKPAITDSCN